MVDARVERSNGQRRKQSLVKMTQKSKVKFHDPEENISKHCYISIVLHIIDTINISVNVLLHRGHNWLECLQQTLPWPNDPTWHGQYFQGWFLYILDHVSISYHHFHYWFGDMIISIIGWFCIWTLFFGGAPVSCFFFAHWHEVISLTVEAWFPFPHFILALYQIYS